MSSPASAASAVRRCAEVRVARGKRYEVLHQVWGAWLSECAYRRPFLDALEVASAHAEPLPAQGGLWLVSAATFCVAFWSAAIVPEGVPAARATSMPPSMPMWVI